MEKKKICALGARWQAVQDPGKLFFYALYKVPAAWTLGEISQRAANRIEHHTGISVKGYKVLILSSYLVHFYNSHFGESEKNKKVKSIDFDDIKEIPNVINNFTTAEISTDGKEDSVILKRRTPKGMLSLVVVINRALRRLSGVSFRYST